MAFTVRLATLADSTHIAKLGAEVFTVTFGHSVPPDELEAYLKDTYTVPAVTTLLEDPTKRTFVATDNENRVVGFAIMAYGTRKPCIEDVQSTIELQRVYVDTAVHGKGIGFMLARRIEKEAQEQGYRNIWLSVWEEHNSGHKAYQRWGYNHVGYDVFTVGTVVQRDHIMMKAVQE
ncbi:acyl-CoA N-acyltransferase [Dactylonectria estremocensis]|uniref:Acyl-CoA N-acyltransferase n=1 Tax=Dactylonectria estremocensis TaxID=1079267 RepID=A0A9P9E026_9HYPO|nr:acyl-CoA N-acyltransferase [Dactylonectria estremocensis]